MNTDNKDYTNKMEKIKIGLTKEEAKYLSSLMDKDVCEYNDFTDLLKAKLEYTAEITDFSKFALHIQKELVKKDI